MAITAATISGRNPPVKPRSIAEGGQGRERQSRLSGDGDAAWATGTFQDGTMGYGWI